MPASEVLIIGAGPYGLSISTHLRARGIDHLIVGRTMDTWRTHMPAGMYLKSEPYGSDMSTPQAGYDLAGYRRSERIEGIERGTPLAIGRFLDYADWYIKQLVPGVSDVNVREGQGADLDSSTKLAISLITQASANSSSPRADQVEQDEGDDEQDDAR